MLEGVNEGKLAKPVMKHPHVFIHFWVSYIIIAMYLIIKRHEGWLKILPLTSLGGNAVIIVMLLRRFKQLGFI